MASIPREEIEYVKRNIPITDVLERHGVRKAGKGLYHCCFHHDEHASLNIWKEQNICKCFACNEGGDVISVYRKLENLGFAEAVYRLEDEYGITEFLDNRNFKGSFNVKLLPLSFKELEFIGLNPTFTVIEDNAKVLNKLSEEIKSIEEDYVKGYTRKGATLEDLMQETKEFCRKQYGTKTVFELSAEYKKDPEFVVDIINHKIREMYHFYSTQEISGKNELIREKLEKLQDKMAKLVHNRLYKEWIKELYPQEVSFEKESEFETEEKDFEVSER